MTHLLRKHCTYKPITAMHTGVESNTTARRPTHWSAIAAELQDISTLGRRFLYIANPGNAGDALIASATWQFFDDNVVKPRPARTRDIRAHDVVIYGGGGNLVPMYQDARAAIEKALQVGIARFVLLPHTVRGHEDLLSTLDDRFSLYGRDTITCEHLLAHVGGARVAMAPDMALGTDVERLQQRAAALPAWWLLLWAGFHQRRRRSYRRWLDQSARVRPSADGLLEVYRGDQESARHGGPSEMDLSGLYCSSLHHRNECDAVSARFLSVIEKASQVSTDRLHVGIGGQLLGKQVRLFDNSYGKNHAVAKAFPSLMTNVSLA